MFKIDYMTKREFKGVLIGFILSLIFVLFGLLGLSINQIQIVEMPIILSIALIIVGIACFAKGLFILREPIKTTQQPI